MGCRGGGGDGHDVVGVGHVHGHGSSIMENRRFPQCAFGYPQGLAGEERKKETSNREHIIGSI